MKPNNAIENKLIEIQNRGGLNADIESKFIARLYALVEDYVQDSLRLIEEVSDELLYFRNPVSQKLKLLFLCNEILVRVLRPTYSIHRILWHTLRYDYREEFVEIADKTKEVLEKLAPKKTQEVFDQDCIMVEDENYGEEFFSKTLLMEKLLTTDLPFTNREEVDANCPLTRATLEYEAMYNYWETKSNKLFKDELKEYKQKNPNVDLQVGLQYTAQLLYKCFDFYHPIFDDRKITFREVCATNDEGEPGEDAQIMPLINSFDTIESIEYASIEVLLYNLLEAVYHRMRTMNIKRQYRVQHELHEALVRLEREWVKAYYSHEFVDEVEALDEISKNSLLTLRKEYEKKLRSLKDANDKVIDFGPYTGKRAIAKFWERAYDSLGFANRYRPEYKIKDEDFLKYTGKIDLIDELLELTEDVEMGSADRQMKPNPTENNYKALVQWLEVEKSEGRDWYIISSKNRSAMCRQLSSLLGWEINQNSLRKAQEQYK